MLRSPIACAGDSVALQSPAPIVTRAGLVALVLLGLGGCTGSVGEGAVGVGGTSGDTVRPVAGMSNGGISSGGSTSSGGAAGGPTNGGQGSSAGQPTAPAPSVDEFDVDPSTAADGVSVASRVLRLGYADYDRTVSDLLHLSVKASADFPAEQPNLGPYEDLGARRASESLQNEFVLSAETLAGDLVANATAFSQVVGCATANTECRDSFIDRFGQQAYRRPLTESEKTRYRALFDRGPELVKSGDALKDGVRLVVEAMLQSPKFLYRVEAGKGVSDTQGVLLTDYEVAVRLSYLFWGTLPDGELFQAAASGKLSNAAGIAEQARRLAASPRVAERVIDFHERWLELEGLSGVSKDQTKFPLFSPDLVRSMAAETRRFVEEVTLTRNGGVRALLTAPIGFVNDSLARLYGLNGTFGSELQRVEFDSSTQRSGILTQAAFLSGHSSASTRTSPILRGVFVLRRLACLDIQPPPPGAEMQEPEQAPAQPLRTTREYFTWKTSMTQCAACHTLINPVGYGFEAFDAIGQFRSVEADAPIDASGTLRLPDGDIVFNGARELVTQLAELSRVRACYAKNWLQYAYARKETGQDLRTLATLVKGLATDDFGARDVMVGITQSAAFSHLPSRE
jgi:hypothetical protein